MFIIFYGQDTFRSSDFLKKTIQSFKEKRDPNNLNTLILDCPNENSNKILEQMLSMPFLAEKKMLVLKNLLSGGKNADILEQIIKRIESDDFPLQNDYIFWEENETFKSKDAKKLFDILKKQKYSREFKKLVEVGLNKWIKTEIQEKNIKIKNDALNYLVLNIGDDLRKLDQILNQAFFYKDGQEIEISDLKLFLEEKVDDNIFNLIDSIFAGQKNKSYKMIYKQYKQGKDASYIFAMILRQIRIFLEIRDLTEKEDGLSSDQIAKKLKLHPFVIKKSLSFTKKYNKKYLQNVYKKLLDIDIKTKTTSSDPKKLINFFVNEI